MPKSSKILTSESFQCLKGVILCTVNTISRIQRALSMHMTNSADCLRNAGCVAPGYKSIHLNCQTRRARRERLISVHHLFMCAYCDSPRAATATPSYSKCVWWICWTLAMPAWIFEISIQSRLWLCSPYRMKFLWFNWRRPYVDWSENLNGWAHWKPVTCGCLTSLGDLWIFAAECLLGYALVYLPSPSFDITEGTAELGWQCG